MKKCQNLLTNLARTAKKCQNLSKNMSKIFDKFEKIGQKLAQSFIDQGAKELLEKAEKLAFK